MLKIFTLLSVLFLSICGNILAQNELIPHETAPAHELAIFGAGCFWKVELRMSKVPGVVSTMVGYSGGHVAHPTYREVCSGHTGHAEVVRVEFDPEKVTYTELLDVFWKVHDPTQLDRQGPDVGRQYRSVIFCTTDLQNELAIESQLNAQVSLTKPIMTLIEPAVPFYKAEEYHQKYLK